MSVYNPPAVGSQGAETVVALSVVAAIATVTVAETSAATAVIIQNAVRLFSPTVDQGTSEDRRLGSKFVYETPGIARISIEAFNFIARPQDAAAAVTAKHRDLLVDGWVGWFLDRRGFGSAPENWVAIAATQKYKAYPVIAGPQVDTAIETSDEGGQFEYQQKFYVTGPVVSGVFA